MARPAKQDGTLTRYMKKKLEQSGELAESQPGKRHRVEQKRRATAQVQAAREQLLNDPGDPFVKKLRKLYAEQLESGVDGVSSKCHYQGLTGLAMSYHNPHPEIKTIMKMHYDSLPQGDKDAIAAYGFMVLMGNV